MKKYIFLLLLAGLSHTLLANSSFAPSDSIQFKEIAFKIRTGETIKIQVGQLAVAENRSKENSATIQLAVLKLPCISSTPGFPIVYLAGGPGESAFNAINNKLYQQMFLKLQQEHDVILMDQRGTGKSLPLVATRIKEDSLVNYMFLSEQHMIAYAMEGNRQALDTFKRRKVDLSGYTTVESTHDLHSLQVALGVEKLTLLAVSYGSHLALSTLRLYPNIIHRCVLVAPVGTNHMEHLPSAYDKQLKRIAKLAAQDSVINKKVPDMIWLLKEVMNKLDKEPVTVLVKEYQTGKMIPLPIGKYGLQMILRLDVSDSKDFVKFPSLLYQINKGEYSLLQSLAEKRYNQFKGGVSGMSTTMRLASGASQSRYKRIKKEGKKALLANTMNTPDIFRKQWAAPDLGKLFRAPVHSPVHVLLVSGTMDANSYQVVEIMKSLPAATHLVIENAGHEDLFSTELIQDKLIDFMIDKPMDILSLSLPKPLFIE